MFTQNPTRAWQRYTGLEGDTSLYAAGQPLTVQAPFADLLDTAGLRAFDLNARVTHMSGLAGLGLFTAPTPAGPLIPIVAFVEGERRVTLRFREGVLAYQNSVPGAPPAVANALSRYVGWVATPNVASPWAFGLQMEVTPRTQVPAGGPAFDPFNGPDFQPWISFRAPCVTLVGSQGRWFNQGASGILDARRFQSVSLTVEVALLRKCVLNIQTANAVDQDWASALTLTDPGVGTLSRYTTILFTRDNGSGTAGLRNFVRWQLAQNTGTSAPDVMQGCFRITGGGR